MLTRRKVFVWFALTTLITSITLYLRPSLYLSVLIPTRHQCCSRITSNVYETSDAVRRHPTKVSLNKNVGTHLPASSSSNIHKSKPLKVLHLTDSGNPHSSSTPLKNGYIMSTGYSGWTGGGTGALLQLQCYMKLNALPMQVVEPAVENSKFHAVLNDKTLLFSDLFDISQYNKLLKQDGKYVRLSPWNDFVQKAPRSTIFVKLHVTSHAKPPEIEWEKEANIVNCSMPKELAFLETEGFCIVKIVNVFYSSNVPFSGGELKDNIMGSWKPDEVTVVLSRWTYSYYIPPGNDVDDFCGNAEWTGRKVLYPSERLLKDIEHYEKLFQIPTTSVAIMMHSERLMEKKESESMIMKHANVHLKELLSVVEELKAKHQNGTPFAAVDIGRFGSLTLPKAFSVGAKSFKSRLIQTIQDTLTSVYDNKWTFSEWEDSFLQATGGIADTGYVAAIQRGIASRAKCLVLFGGGRFQFVALNEYLHNHPKKSDQCVRYVYVADRFKKYYDEQVQQ